MSRKPLESHASPRLEDGVTTARSRKRDPPTASWRGRGSAGPAREARPGRRAGPRRLQASPVWRLSLPSTSQGRAPAAAHRSPQSRRWERPGQDGGPSRRAPRPQMASSPRAVTALPAAPPGCRLHVHGRPPLFFRGKEPCSVNAITFQTAGCQVFITCEFHDGRASALGERAKVRFGWRDHLGPRRTF